MLSIGVLDRSSHALNCVLAFGILRGLELKHLWPLDWEAVVMVVVRVVMMIVM